jgi:hypothetical protein
MTDAGQVHSMTKTEQRISVRGQIRSVPALKFGDHVITINGSLVKVARIFDAYWLEADKLPDPRVVIEQLRNIDKPPDLFTFTQRVPDETPALEFFHEWDNVAVVPVSSHDHWLRKQVSPAARRNVKGSEKKGVVVRACDFDESYIRGIMSISDESPIRAGRRYWHYGKDFATVEAEQGTYRERSTYLGAFMGSEMIGYLKLVWDTRTAAIMQIVSTLKHRDARPNNALLSEAVRHCAERGVSYLQYERFVYGDKVDSPLTRFKRENGFVRMDVPVYYVPLTTKGHVALRLGLHKGQKDRLPLWVTRPLRRLRDSWYERQTARTLNSQEKGAI